MRTKFQNLYFMYVCLFVSVLLEKIGDVTITSDGLQLLTYARQSWPLSSDGSLACQVVCDMGQPFIMVNSRGGGGGGVKQKKNPQGLGGDLPPLF